MPQTLRKTFNSYTHSSLKPIVRRSLLAPLSLEAMLQELHQYLEHRDLLQPRQQSIDRILREALA